MSKTTLSPKSFSALVRAGDSRQFNVDLKNCGAEIIKKASESAIAGTIDLSDFKSTQLRGKNCVSYKAYATALLLRSLTRYFSKRLKVTLPSRDRVVRGVIETLMDGTPIFAIRKDITSFYESISVEPLKRKLLYDVPGSTLVRSYVRAYFSTHCGNAQVGLPRGIGLSALLAEVSMKDFDAKIKAIPGVYKYYRYSDDILIFSTIPAAEIDVQIQAALPAGMKFNSAKCSEVYFPGKSEPKSTESLFVEYLGYCFSALQNKDREASRVVKVSVSERKLAKIKTRVILSLLAHSRSPSWTLLRDRCRFLTCNFKVRRNGADVVKVGTHVYSGIYYNYKMSGTYYFKSGKLHAEPYDAAELKALDGFYHSILCRQHATNKVKLTALQLAQLRKFSFSQGFSLRIKGRFAPERVALIKRAWRNV